MVIVGMKLGAGWVWRAYWFLGVGASNGEWKLSDELGENEDNGDETANSSACAHWVRPWRRQEQTHAGYLPHLREVLVGEEGGA